MYPSNQKIAKELAALAREIFHNKNAHAGVRALAGELFSLPSPTKDYTAEEVAKLGKLIEKYDKKERSQLLHGDNKKQFAKMLSMLKSLEKGTKEELGQKKDAKAQVVPCRVDYKSEDNPNGLSNEDQARAFLNYARELTKNSDKKVGLTYSANDQQSARIHAENNKDDKVNFKNYGINKGSNQAQVMIEIGELLKSEYNDLNGKFVILPVTTCTKNPLKLNQTEKTNVKLLKRDLNHIDDFLQKGNTVLAWKNQTTKENEVAIGGGVEARIKGKDGMENKALLDQAKKDIRKLAQQYPAPEVNLTSSVKNNSQLQKSAQQSNPHDTKWIINSGLHLSAKSASGMIGQHKNVQIAPMHGPNNTAQNQVLMSQKKVAKETPEMPPLPAVPSKPKM